MNTPPELFENFSSKVLGPKNFQNFTQYFKLQLLTEHYFHNFSLRYPAVKEALFFATCSGVPSANS